MPEELGKEEQYAMSFFSFRAETLVDNAKLKNPGTGINSFRLPASFASALFLFASPAEKSLSMPEQAPAKIPSVISTRWFIPGWCSTSMSDPVAPVFASLALKPAERCDYGPSPRRTSRRFKGNVQRCVNQTIVLLHQSAPDAAP